MSDETDLSYLHDTADAHEWAKAFNVTAQKLGYGEMDEGWLIGWFANAMMAQHDHDERTRNTAQ